MPERLYVKTSPSTWELVRNLFVKTTPSSWAAVTDAWVKVSSTLWRQFWSSVMSPSQVVEIDGTYGGYNNDTLRLRGKNYVWSPTPQSLKYYFRDVSSVGTFYFGPGGSSGATATNTISFYPSSTTYLTVDPSGTDYLVGGLTQYFFEVRATGASGTVYSSISSGSAPQLASPLAPTLSISSTTSTSATITVTAAADTTGTWGFSSWGATYRYIVYTYDSVGGTIYSGGGRGGISATSSSQNITLTGLVSGRQYTVYVLPTTGTAGSRPFPYDASTQTNGYSGYPGVEASIQVTTASPPTIVTNPTFTLQSGTANTVNSVYRLTSGTWNGAPTEYRYEVGRNDIAGTVLATFPSTTTWTTQTYYDHTFTSTSGGYSIYGSVIANNANGQSSPAFAEQTVGPIIASPQSTGQQRRVNLPSNFTMGTTVYISTNGFIGIGADPSGSISLPTSGLYLSPLQGDQRQTALYTYSDSSNFYVRWQGARYNDAAQTIDYQAKFYWNSTAVDVYFVTNNLSSSNPASTTAVYNNGSETVNWSSSSSQSSSLISTSIMTRNTTQDGEDDKRTVITTTAPPSASGFARSDSTATPSQPSTLSFSSSNNQVTTSWTNGSPITSVSFAASGAGVNTSYTDTSAPFITSDLSNYSSSGTYTATVTNFNNSLQVRASWSQSNSQSYQVTYSSSVFGPDQTAIINNSGSSVDHDIGWSSGMGSFTFQSLTLWSGANGTGTSNTFNVGLSAITPSQKSSSRSNSTFLTFTSANRSAPSIFNVVKSGGNYLVYFSGGTTGGAYQVWWQTSSSTPSTCGPGDAQGTSSPITVQNLTGSAGTTYYFFVRSTSATNTTDCGPSSTASAWSSGYSYTEPSSGTPPATPTNGGGSFATGTNYVTNATFTRSATGTTPITYNWSVYAGTSSGFTGGTFWNSGSFSSSTLGGTANIPQQTWNQALYGNWARYEVYATNGVNPQSGTLTWWL